MGSVYKVTDGENVYYGTTIQPLNIRLNKHKCVCNNCVTKYFNKDNMTIELVENVEDKEQLLIRERYYIENNECYNRRIPNRTITERKEVIKNYNTTPYTCSCGKTLLLQQKARHERSKYHINHKSV